MISENSDIIHNKLVGNHHFFYVLGSLGELREQSFPKALQYYNLKLVKV